jgi:hypothetical protein
VGLALDRCFTSYVLACEGLIHVQVKPIAEEIKILKLDVADLAATNYHSSHNASHHYSIKVAGQESL